MDRSWKSNVLVSVLTALEGSGSDGGVGLPRILVSDRSGCSFEAIEF